MARPLMNLLFQNRQQGQNQPSVLPQRSSLNTRPAAPSDRSSSVETTRPQRSILNTRPPAHVFDPSVNALIARGNAGTNLDVLRAMNFFGGQASATGFESLQDILNLRGATDPMLFNQSLADIALTGQRSQDAIQGQLAALNLGGSGIGQGLAAASAAATDRGRARAIAEENRAREERMREDLLLLRQLLFDPTIALRTGNPLQGVNQPSDLEKVLGIGTGIAGAIAEF